MKLNVRIIKAVDHHHPKLSKVVAEMLHNVDAKLGARASTIEYAHSFRDEVISLMSDHQKQHPEIKTRNARLTLGFIKGDDEEAWVEDLCDSVFPVMTALIR